jgi:glycosyltransferase involved in cell wall biosynthesis
VINGKNIICFASGWDFHPTSKHHVMRRLAERNHVIWVNWHSSRRPKVHLADLRAIGAKIRQIGRGPRRVSDGITVVTPFQLPIPGSGLARRFNIFTVRRAIWNVLECLPTRPVQLWSFAPDMGNLVGQFGEERVVYYCVDAFGEFPGYDRSLIERRERELLARSDVVITTSMPLYQNKSQLHPNVHLVEHGVDYDRLSRAVKEELPIPLELAGLPRPIIGYVGVVGEWVDLDRVAALARARPGASIVIIGPSLISHGPLTHLPNVYWLGERDHATLPGYLRLFDVGLIPFRHVPLTRNANPIKLYEYLAAGVPVISTGLPSVRAVSGAVWIADDAASMVRCCDEALRHNAAPERTRRSGLMKAESWEARLETISRVVQGHPEPVAPIQEADVEEESVELAGTT